MVKCNLAKINIRVRIPFFALKIIEMNIEFLLYYVFTFITLISAIMVIYLSNAIYSILFLILTFFNTALLLLLLGAEFFAFLLLIVYVGAIAVLFLFIVMMLNIKLENKNKYFNKILPLWFLLIVIFSSIFFVAFVEFDLLNIMYINLSWLAWQTESLNITNIEVIGKILYTDISLLFILSSLILLVAMIGSITLTMHQRTNLKKQKLELQLIRKFKGTVKFINLRK